MFVYKHQLFMVLHFVSRFDSGARRDGLRGIAWRFEVLETRGVLYVSNAITLQQHTASCSVYRATLGILILWTFDMVCQPSHRATGQAEREWGSIEPRYMLQIQPSSFDQHTGSNHDATQERYNV